MSQNPPSQQPQKILPLHLDSQYPLLAGVLVRIAGPVEHPGQAGLDPGQTGGAEVWGGIEPLKGDGGCGDGGWVRLVYCYCCCALVGGLAGRVGNDIL